MALTSKKERFSRERGATLVEYSLLVTLIALLSICAMQFFGDAIGNSLYQSTLEAFPAAGGICDQSNPNYPKCDGGFGF